MKPDFRRCIVRIDNNILKNAEEKGLIYPSKDRKRFFGLSPIIASALQQKTRGGRL